MRNHLVAVLAAALLATACGQSNLLTSSPTAPSATSATGGSSRLSTRSEPYSCPSEAPGGLSATTNQGTATITWNSVANTSNYILQVEKRDADEDPGFVYVVVYEHTLEGTTDNFRPNSAGIYRARVRVWTCGNAGDWSPYVDFSFGQANPLPPVIAPPIEDGGDDEYTPPTDEGGDDNDGPPEGSGDAGQRRRAWQSPRR